MQGRDWQIGRVLGIPIKIHVSWFFIFALVTWSLATGYLPESLPGLPNLRYWGMGGMGAILLFSSVLLHELGHSYVALRYRIPISQITLFVFGGMAHMRQEPPGPRAEFLIAIAGPIVSFFIGGVLLGMVFLTDAPRQYDGFLALGLLLGSINLQLGLFNLIPGFPLDGGRVLRAGLWAWSGDFLQATRRAALAGQGFGLAFGLVGGSLILGASWGVLPGLFATHGGWIALIGAFLFLTAKGSRRQAGFRASLTQLRVRDVMVHQVVTLDPGVSVEDCVTHHFFRYGYAGFPVIEDGRPIGMLAVEDLQTVPRSLWSLRQVRDVMQPWTTTMEIGPETSALHALESMLLAERSWLGVVNDGQLIGMVTRSGIARSQKLLEGGDQAPGMRS